MKVKGMRGIYKGVPDVGAVKRQSKDSSRSAEPEEEVEARLPCWRVVIFIRLRTGDRD